MKKTNKENVIISQAIEEALGITFMNEEFSLGKWGEVDDWCHLSYDTLILLECEKGQKHPNTNLLKLYPYLEEFPDAKIILIHYFYPENKAPKSRIALCNFLGDKLEAEFGIRFQYIHMKCQQDALKKELLKHNRRLMQMLPQGWIEKV